MAKIISFSFLLFVILGGTIQGQIIRGVIGNGGNTISDGGLVLKGTIGQTAIGNVNGTQFQHRVGFWYYAGRMITGVQTVPEVLPKAFWLYQNFPNPFNPVTTIRFAVPKISHVQIAVFDLLGRQVMTLVDKEMSPGEYTIQVHGEGLGSGIYFYRMSASGFVQTRRFIVLK